MKLRQLHSWDLTTAQMRELQRRLSGQASHRGGPRQPTTVAGVDLALEGETGFGALVLLSFPELRVLAELSVTAPLDLPYIPGLLSFREIPVLLRLFERLEAAPDLVFVDGQGRLHPREFGLACHLGLLLDCPTIGCAKSLLCGSYRQPPAMKGSYSPVRYRGRELGMALRTRENCKVIFVSSGHRIGLKRALELSLAVTGRYRVPEPTRLADILAGRCRREQGQ